MVEAYYQMKITGVSPGTNRLAVWTFYKVAPGNAGEIAFAKGAAQAPEVTFNVLRDASVATANKLFKVVSS